MMTLMLAETFGDEPAVSYPPRGLFPQGKLALPALLKSHANKAAMSDKNFTAQECYLRFREAATEAQQEIWLDELLTRYAAPLSQSILRRKLCPYTAADALEIEQQIHVKLLTRLQATDEAPLQDFAAYVAVITFHACAEWQRQRQPQRHALKNRLRYLLTHTNGLALWEAAPRVWWCGRNEWRHHRQAIAATQLQACRAALPVAAPLREITDAVFAQCRRPVELDELVNLLAEALGIHDEVVSVNEKIDVAEARPDAATMLERRAYLKNLWDEIKALPLQQRRALLLNLRDPEGRSQLALFHLTGVADLRELAQALELSLDEFVALWNQLPLDDLTLARRLDVTRQQIINLRLAARRRLTRRLSDR